MTPTNEIRAKLDELGIAWVAISESATEYTQEGILYRAYETCGGLQVAILTPVTPEQAIAATMGVEETYTREECEAQFVRGFSLGCLPSGSDPCWDENRQTLDEHMAELGWVRKDAATVGRRDTMELWPEWEHVLFSNVSDEVAQDNLNECVHELLDKAATVGAGTCHNEVDNTFVCSECGAHVRVTNVGRSYVDEDGKRWYSTSNEHKFRHCPNCGRRIEVSE